jgi:hypothetical protein
MAANDPFSRVLDVVAKRMPRMYIQTLLPLAGRVRTLEAQFMPIGLTEKLSTKYVGWEIPGLSHDVLQWINTKPYELTFDLRFFTDNSPDDRIFSLDKISEARRLLLALCLPRKRQQTVKDIAPYRVMVVLPKIISTVCVLEDVSIRHERYNVEGDLVDYTATVKFREILDMRVSAEDTYQHGMLRGQALSSSSGQLSDNYSDKF